MKKKRVSFHFFSFLLPGPWAGLGRAFDVFIALHYDMQFRDIYYYYYWYDDTSVEKRFLATASDGGLAPKSLKYIYGRDPKSLYESWTD
jgi:hypothetical protein